MICSVHQVEYIWVCSDFRKILNRAYWHVTEKSRSQVVYVFIYICMRPIFDWDRLKWFTFPIIGAICRNCFGAVCLSSSSCSIFVHPFPPGSFRLVSFPIMTIDQEIDILAVFFIDKSSIAVSIEFLICWSTIHYISCKDSMLVYYHRLFHHTQL